MDLLKNLKDAINGAAGKLTEANRKNANLNRLRTVIRIENGNADKEFLALGRYYYNHLRDSENDVTETHCVELDGILERIANAQALMEQVNAGADVCDCGDECTCGEECCCGGEEEAPEEGSGCCCGCGAEETETEEVTLEDVESFDSDPTQEDAQEEKQNSELPFEG